MSRAAVLAIVLAVAPSEACKRLVGKEPDPAPAEPPPAPVPLAPSTVPPVYSPPDPADLPAAAPTTTSPDLTKARALARAGDHKKVRALLEKKTRAGKAGPEEAALLLESCTALRDKSCLEMVKAKHPGLQP